MTANVRLYALPASHPCAAVEAAMRIKSIPYERVDLLPMTQMLIGPLRFGGITVPGIRIDGERVVGSRAIMRRLDELVPEPPLLPADEQLRRRVLDVERWGEEILQEVPRRVLDMGFVRDPACMESYVGDAKLPLPTALLRPALPLTARMMALRASADDAGAHADVLALPRQLDRIEEWIAEGVLGGELVNAADLQIGSSLRLLMTIADVRPLLAERPAAALAELFGPMAGEVPAGTLPRSWFAADAAQAV
jgi:glutathione S-transferase